MASFLVSRSRVDSFVADNICSQSFRICQMNSIRGVHVASDNLVSFFLFSLSSHVVDVAAAVKKSSVRSSVDVVRRSRSQGSVEG